MSDFGSRARLPPPLDIPCSVLVKLPIHRISLYSVLTCYYQPTRFLHLSIITHLLFLRRVVPLIRPHRATVIAGILGLGRTPPSLQLLCSAPLPTDLLHSTPLLTFLPSLSSPPLPPLQSPFDIESYPSLATA
jgi:hypothetical protein